MKAVIELSPSEYNCGEDGVLRNSGSDSWGSAITARGVGKKMSLGVVFPIQNDRGDQIYMSNAASESKAVVMPTISEFARSRLRAYTHTRYLLNTQGTWNVDGGLLSCKCRC